MGAALYKPYPAYKPSGVEWLGDIPEGWVNVPIKYMALEPGSLFLDGDWIESKNISESGIKYITTGNVAEGHYREQGEGFISEKTFEKLDASAVFEGDILVSRLNPPIGRACIVPNLKSRVVTSVDNVIFRPDPEFHRPYVVYLLSCPEYFAHTSNLARGATMQRISRGLLGNIRLVLPSLPEQTKIAAFLDYETGKIDALIAKQGRLIELLEEKRQAVISHAVTKGLNPNAPLRPSGIDWLGDVPEHWDFVPLLSVSEVIDPNPSHRNPEYVEEGFPFISTQEFTRNGGIITDTPRRVSERTVLEQEARCNFRTGSIVFSRKGTIGATRVLPTGVRLAILDSLCVINPMQGILPEFLATTLPAYYITAQYGPTVNGAALPQLSVGKVRSLKLLLPPLEEQERIVCHLKEMLGKIDKLLNQAQSAITMLRERRTALISAAVTGKIDVRNWQPPQPLSDTDLSIEDLQEAAL